MEDGMTVNELIAELQVLAAQGYGELDAVVGRPFGQDSTTNIRVGYCSKLKRNFRYNKINEGEVVLPHAYIYSDDD
jgi:hypothetical protein